MRLARRGGRLALVVIGLAAASAMLAAVLAGTVGAEDRAVGRKISTSRCVWWTEPQTPPSKAAT